MDAHFYRIISAVVLNSTKKLNQSPKLLRQMHHYFFFFFAATVVIVAVMIVELLNAFCALQIFVATIISVVWS